MASLRSCCASNPSTPLAILIQIQLELSLKGAALNTSLQLIPAAKTASMPRERPFRMDPDDDSGTPVALIELARRAGRLELRDEVDPEDVLIEFPMGPRPAAQTGASRFVRLRGGGYALIR